MNPPLKTQLNRRDFLRSTTAALAAISLPAIIPASAFGAGSKIALGCIGVGGMGTGNMKNFLPLEDCRVVAVCDTYADPVSYTHLDVYKRQTSGCSSTSGGFDPAPHSAPLRLCVMPT